jgi:hypothetical protein
MTIPDFLTQRLLRGVVRRLNNRKLEAVGREVARRVPFGRGKPIAFFKASSGIDDLSWNSAFHLLASWGIRLNGTPVVYFACRAGMSRCVLGTNRDRVDQPPPCNRCIGQAETLYAGVPTERQSEAGATPRSSHVHWFPFKREPALEAALAGLTLRALTSFVWPLRRGGDPGDETSVPLGALCLPGLRWILRRHTLEDDEETRYLLREYILSAWNVANQFSDFLDRTEPLAVVVFNGQFFPEAVARFVAQSRGLRVVTHEVGLQPASAFFTDGEATAYPIAIPEDFELSRGQNLRLDAYLEKRFEGRFTMAGIKFWPTMHGLDAGFISRARRFKQIVPVFTNVIFDTSQPHANTVFPDMFAWLDLVLNVARGHKDTLFVIRAHPDETRLRKESRETVQAWAERNAAEALPNVDFVGPRQPLSSYQLIQRCKFVMVYNSTIGLEASIMGKPVLCGGRARFTQYPTVFFPQSAHAQRDTMEEFLASDRIDVPPVFQRNARRFLYFQLFRTSLPFDRFLKPSVRTTHARLTDFSLDELERSPAIRTINHGLLAGGKFLLDESSNPS